MTNPVTHCTRLFMMLALFTPGLLAAQTAATSSSGTATTDSTEKSMTSESGDKAFVKKALEGGNAEVKLGQLAEQKSQSEDVKQFGQKMVNDHTQLGDQMKPIAQQLKVSVPTGIPAKDQMLYSKLEKLSGSEFDREYIKAMLKDHQEDLKEFKKEASTGKNPEVKQAAQQGSTVISQHLSMIQQIAQKHQVSASGGE